MACQIILIVEADEQSRTDFIYINSILREYYKIHLRNDIKISKVFMGGKSHYNQKKILQEIRKYIKDYSHIGDSHVVYCFDTDRFESKPEDKKLLEDEEVFCNTNEYDFVWFCHDIEEVFWGKSVPKNEKVSKVKKYLTQNQVKSLVLDNFRSSSMVRRKSNLLSVIERYLETEVN